MKIRITATFAGLTPCFFATQAMADAMVHSYVDPPHHHRPSWLTPNVKALAQSIYDDRTFDQMLLLADSLVKSGCDNAEILSHCRGDEPHVRGCWVVDAVLGKG